MKDGIDDVHALLRFGHRCSVVAAVVSDVLGLSKCEGRNRG